MMSTLKATQRNQLRTRATESSCLGLPNISQDLSSGRSSLA
jgi:hypothetical protein